MLMLFGFFLLSLGIGFFINILIFGVRYFFIVISLLSSISGLLIIYISYKKGKQSKIAITLMNRQCLKCKINVAADCSICPSCGEKIN